MDSEELWEGEVQTKSGSEECKNGKMKNEKMKRRPLTPKGALELVLSYIFFIFLINILIPL